MTAAERTGWRDFQLSSRHRVWGFDCPAVDVDFLLIEYDRAEPVALIDYKESRSTNVGQLADTSTKAFARVGERANLPAFVVRYRYEPVWEFFVIALNELASGLLPANRRMDEEAFVVWLWQLRGRLLPAEIRQAIRAAPKDQP